MKDKLTDMRRLLDEFESELGKGLPDASTKIAHDSEVIEATKDIIDYLMPLLSPYEAALYWYAFRMSILATGQKFCRISVSDLQTGVIRSVRSNAQILSFDLIRTSLNRLIEIGALGKRADPTSQMATLYEVLVPNEIPACRELIAARADSAHQEIDIEKEADFYNVRENRSKIFERDEYKCRYCGKLLAKFTATLDHVKPVREGGNHSFDNLVTACLDCNSKKNRKPVGDFLADSDFQPQ